MSAMSEKLVFRSENPVKKKGFSVGWCAPHGIETRS
jgi:hypothetical protein